MGIIVKYILKNISEKKVRTCLILLSVMCSSALFFASSSIADTMVNMYENLARAQVGKAALVIRAGRRSPAAAFRIQREPVEGVRSIVGEVSAGGVYTLPREGSAAEGETRQLQLRGFNLSELEGFNPVRFSHKATGRPFSGNHIILGRAFAVANGFHIGDTIPIEIRGTTRRLVVWGIARPAGVFRESPQSEYFTAVIPLDYAAYITGLRGSVTTAYVVTDPDADIPSVRNRLQEHYRRYDVSPPFSPEDLRGMLSTMTIPFYIMTAMVLFISIFIIYSTFKVITVERLPVIGTFRSIGANKKMTTRVLMGESLAYGVLGGILGIAAGIGILYLMSSVIADDPYGGKMDFQMQFGLGRIVSAFVLAIIVSLFSSWIPIMRVSKLPVKDLVLNRVEVKTWKNSWKSIAAGILLACGFLVPAFTPHSIRVFSSLSGLFLIITAVVLSVPLLTGGFLAVFHTLFRILFGNEGIIAVQNLKDNKNVLNNIILLTIGIMTLLMINTISYSVGIEVLDAYHSWKFDIMLSVYNADRNIEQSIRAVPGVTGTYAAREQWSGTNLVGHDYRIGYLQGVDPATHGDFVSTRITDSLGNPESALMDLGAGRTIMVAGGMRDTLQLQLGDTLVLDTRAGEKPYTVIGFYDSLMQNGSNAMIHQRNYRSDMRSPFINTFFIRIAPDVPADDVLAAMQSKFRDRGVWGRTIQQIRQANTDANNQLFGILTAFSVLAMAIGVFGVFNNYAISFIERRRSLAIMKSVGMSRHQIVKMIFTEALAGGIIAGAIGVIGGTLLIMGSTRMMQALFLPLRIHIAHNHFIAAVCGGMLVSILASLSPAVKNSRLNVIEAIKYE